MSGGEGLTRSRPSVSTCGTKPIQPIPLIGVGIGSWVKSCPPPQPFPAFGDGLGMGSWVGYSVTGVSGVRGVPDD